ncbi:aminoglycoside phosphotransferase family protein [Kribbella sp. NPDC026611]|uniref:aminoglycoside phosphotransferase family protein n=1 Tax=Kribbella sp. NPDC026611 TaxID=3154911 RepID=UPI0033D99A2E
METKTVEALVSVGERYVGRAPAFAVEPPWWSEVEAVTQHLDALLGVPTVVLRLVDTTSPTPMRGGRITYHVQALAEPRAGVLDPTVPADWDAVIAAHPLRATWAEVDGPSRLIEWAQGVVDLQSPTQVKTWNLSCLIRFPEAWAKANSTFNAVDSDVIHHVQQYDESLVPEVLATSPQDRWSLLAHVPGTDCWEPDQATVEDVVSRWVGVQAAMAPAVHSFAAPQLLPSELADQIARLVDRSVTGDRAQPARRSRTRELAPQVALTAEELDGLERLVAGLPKVVDELESSGLPVSLVHGDFHPGNWRSDGTRRVIVDWADTFVGHPAVDAQRLRDFLPAEKRQHVIDVWSAAWQRHVPGCQPERAFGPMKVLGPLTYALMYQRFLDNIEPDERIYHRDDPVTCLRAALVT